MQSTPDGDLLDEFARTGSEAAFGELVRRHVALVHSVALRHTQQPQHAEEITQAVFIILARKAAAVGRREVLSGWLYQTARLTAANFRRAEFRRIHREQEAFMQSTLEQTPPDLVWPELAPLLDEAMAGLGATDRNAVVLRYFENKNLAEVGTALGLEERAAQKRVHRSLEKMRRFFAKRGVSLTAAVIAGAMSAHSVQAAPVGLAKAVTAVAVTKGALAGGSTLTLIKGALKVMAWTKAKMTVTVALVILAAGTGTLTIKEYSDSKNPWKRMDTLSARWKKIVDESGRASLAIMMNQSSSLEKREALNKARVVAENQKLQDIYARFFEHVPAGIVIQPTQFKKYAVARSPADQIIGKAFPFRNLLAFAYGTGDQLFLFSRIILPPNAPEENYDFIVNVPDHAREKFQQAIEHQFGCLGRIETLETNVLLLRTNGAAPAKLKFFTDYDQKNYQIADPFWLADNLAAMLHHPVMVDPSLMPTNPVALPKDSDDPNLIRQILTEQLGPVEFIPTNLPVKMLLVNQVK